MKVPEIIAFSFLVADSSHFLKPTCTVPSENHRILACGSRGTQNSKTQSTRDQVPTGSDSILSSTANSINYVLVQICRDAIMSTMPTFNAAESSSRLSIRTRIRAASPAGSDSSEVRWIVYDYDSHISTYDTITMTPPTHSSKQPLYTQFLPRDSIGLC